MAGDWIKIEENTPDKPEVQKMASILKIDPDAVTGKLIRVWVWASRSCNADGVTDVTVKALLDRITCVTGFVDSMLQVGWLIQDGEELRFPNFDYHNSQTAKTRAKSNKRVAKHRNEKRNCNGESVTHAFQKALPEKRREEKNNINSLSARAREDPVLDLDQDARQEASVVIPPCTKNEAEQFGAQTGIPGDLVVEWYEKHDSNDWRPYGGNPPMTTKSWKFDLKNFWKHRKAKDDERRNAGTRNQRNGAEAVGKVRINAANDRNNFVDQATLDAYARKDRIKEIADLIGLWINTERWGSCTTLHEWYEDPLMPDIIEYMREKDEQLFNKISELGFIDAESGRWTGPTRSTR